MDSKEYPAKSVSKGFSTAPGLKETPLGRARL
jgi:hypothetical protein